MVEHRKGEEFVQIVYAKVQSNGKTELVPLKLYVDGSLEQLQSTLLPSSQAGNDKMLLANRYEMQRVLGQGGFGRTYLTIDRYRFNEPCVVKEFLPQHEGEVEAQKSRELFEREAKILHQIDRAQIPKFYACFEENNRLFIVQEYIKGQTYSALLRERQQQGHNFSEAEVIELLKNLLPVLSYLHERQIVHRDIAPDNIMLSDDCHLPVLIDFGIGRSALIQNQESAQNIGRSNSAGNQKSIVGKLGYAPYEQIWLGQSYPSSDLYALAVTVIVLLTGLNPQALSLRDNWHAHAVVSDGLVKILNRMWEETPIHRYQTAAAVLADLQRLCANPQTQLSPPGNSNGATTTLTTSPAPTAIQPSGNNSLSANFIDRCERELLDYIGPIAKFLVKDTFAKNPHLSVEAAVFALAQHIPQPERAIEFRKRLLV
jgi:serine/threonine protein kinase